MPVARSRPTRSRLTSTRLAPSRWTPRRPALRPLAAAALAVLVLPLAACGEQDATTTEGEPAAGVSCEYVAEGQAAKQVSPPPETADPAQELTISTNQGDIGVTLDTENAPCTAHSFTSLAEQGYFDDTPCHRLTDRGIFVLQCGDPTGTGTGGPGYRFGDELSGDETYPAGTLAMANAGPDTNGSQFFIVYRDTALPPSYTVFGRIDDAGLQVVQDIAAKGSDDSNGPGDGAPRDEVVIESVS